MHMLTLSAYNVTALYVFNRTQYEPDCSCLGETSSLVAHVHIVDDL